MLSKIRAGSFFPFEPAPNCCLLPYRYGDPSDKVERVCVRLNYLWNTKDGSEFSEIDLCSMHWETYNLKAYFLKPLFLKLKIPLDFRAI